MRFEVSVPIVVLTALLLFAACGDEAPTPPAAGDTAGAGPEPGLAPGQTPAPAPEPAPEPAPPKAVGQPEDFVIYLRKGESLADVAQRAGLDEAAVRAASGLAAGAAAPQGTPVVLRLTPSAAAAFMEQRVQALGPRPAPRQPDAAAPGARAVAGSGTGAREPVVVQVRTDEFLGLYAEWAGVPLRDVLAANPDLDPDRIARGQRVVVPVVLGRRIEFEQAREDWHARRQAAKTGRPVDAGASPGATPGATADGGAPTCSRTYRLRQGDAIWKLARRWDTRVKEIQRCNPKLRVDRVTAGQVIQVPDAARLP